MDTNTHPLLAEIEAYLDAAETTKTRFGKDAVGDGKFVDRLRSGGNITWRTETRVRQFMADHPPRRSAAE